MDSQFTQETLRVLLVEDDETEADLVTKMLDEKGWWDFSLHHVSSMGDALREIDTRSFDVSLVDLSLPDADRLEIIQQLQKFAPDMPVVVLTGNDDYHLAMDAVRGGAQDYLLKRETYGSTMARALRYAIERKRIEQELRQARKMEAIGQLTGGIAHDFNNLLQVTLGNMELLAAKIGTDSSLRPFIINTLNAAQRGANLTQRLLAFARKQRLQPELIHLSDLVQDMISLIRQTLGEVINVETNIAPDCWPVYTDSNQLENALLNLVINARDAMPAGGMLTINARNITVDAATYSGGNSRKPGNYAVLSVTDNGLGMTANVLKQAFDPYFTTKEVGKGSGLGLSMVYGFAYQTGGFATIESELGKGTTVYLYLPQSDLEKSEIVAEERTITSGRGRTVLIVDDEPAIVDTLALYLIDIGFNVHTATSFDEATEKLHTLHILDLLISDMILPDHKNGLDLYNSFKAEFSDLGFILMTGNAGPESMTGNDTSEAFPILLKPFGRNTLNEAIEVAFSSK